MYGRLAQNQHAWEHTVLVWEYPLSMHIADPAQVKCAS